MERFTIEKLQGTNRNAVEGVTDAPEVLRGLQFKRAGGYIPLGGKREDWLNERGFSKLLQENNDFLLTEDTLPTKISTDWQPAADFGTADLLSQDDTTLALINGPQIWFNNQLNTTTASYLSEQMSLSLAPRAAILAPWRRIDDAYVGGATYVTPDNVLTEGVGAGTVTFTPNGTGGPIPAGDYEFVWVVESPTENGLVVHSVGTDDYTVAPGGINDLTVELSEVYEEGSVIRLYYRSDADPPEEGFELIGLAVSDGVTQPEIFIDDLGTFVPTNEVLLNFSPGRIEAHNGRMWGVASEDSFVPFLPSSVLVRAGGYMSVNSGVQSDLRQYGVVDAADKGLVATDDFVELVIKELQVRRTSKTLPVIIELFNNQDDADSDKALFGYLEYRVNDPSPYLRVGFTADGVVEHTLVDERLPVSLLQLGTMVNTERFVRNVKLTVTLKQVSDNGDGSITSFTDFEVEVGTPAVVYSANAGVVGTNTDAWADWTAYSAAGDTKLALGNIPVDLLLPCVLGNRFLKVRSIRTGNGSTTFALGDIEDYDPSVNLTAWTSSSPNAEPWVTNTEANMIVEYRGATPEVLAGPSINANLTIVFSEVGSVNRSNFDNFLVLTPLSSRRITALASTPAGLLVFLENETFLIRGDIATNNLVVQRLSGTIGNDPGVIPARLGGVVFPIYKGEVYAVNLGGGDVDFGGSIVNVSQPVWKPDDGFVQVVGEPLRNHLVALTDKGRVFRLDIIVQQWINDVFDDTPDVRYLISACLCQRFGTRYNVGGFLEVVDSSIVDPPLVKWSDLDMGDKGLMKLWRRVEVFTNGSSGLPVLRWAARGQSGVVSGLDKGEGRWVFTMPRGVVDVKADLEFEFVDAGAGFTFEPPVVIEFAPRYRER